MNMSSDKLDIKIKKINDALKLKSHEEKLKFDAVKIHLNIMHQVQELLDKNDMSHSYLAELLNVSEAYISKLFSGDKLLNIEKIAQIQWIFNTKFASNFIKPYKNKSSNKKRTGTLSAGRSAYRRDRSGYAISTKSNN